MRFDAFNFGGMASEFDEHIERSIPGRPQLRERCTVLSRRFVQDGSCVVDIGCSTGALLRQIWEHNGAEQRQTSYIGIEIEPAFQQHWAQAGPRNLSFAIADCRFYPYNNVSFAVSLFTVQFLRPADKIALLESLWQGMLPGGALLIAEKIYAETGRMQDALTFPYYDEKLSHFSADEILTKERRLRGQMTLWTEAELRQNLKDAGFRDLELVWASFPFIAVLALK